MEFVHKSVLLHECIEALCIRPDGVYLDGTLGGAAMVGILIALRQRLQEIKGGEENDASQY